MAAIWQRWWVGTSPRRTLGRCLLWAALTYVLFGGLARPMLVRGRSMEPTVRDGSLRFAHMWRYAWRDPARGQVVVIAMPGGRTFYCKRVLGLPGEDVAFQNGALLINGRAVPESYLADAGTWTVPPVTLGEHEFYVVGDNRTLSMAEQVAGVVARHHIVGGLWL